mmetsp:Transcript_7586/g.16305  ORF Transcript_7586/g.16305 Transcript_7586/m.16305 type:complete len:201 (-) Transcript_7586:168-770(-)
MARFHRAHMLHTQIAAPVDGVSLRAIPIDIPERAPPGGTLLMDLKIEGALWIADTRRLQEQVRRTPGGSAGPILHVTQLVRRGDVATPEDSSADTSSQEWDDSDDEPVPGTELDDLGEGLFSPDPTQLAEATEGQEEVKAGPKTPEVILPLFHSRPFGQRWRGMAGGPLLQVPFISVENAAAITLSGAALVVHSEASPGE